MIQFQNWASHFKTGRCKCLPFAYFLTAEKYAEVAQDSSQHKLSQIHDPRVKIGMVTIWEQKHSSFKTGQKIESSFKTGMVMIWVPI
jgi:hypothetical protein